MNQPMGLDKKHRSIAFYPGVELRENVEYLFQVYKDAGTTFSEAIRPWLREEIRKHAKEIATLQEKSDSNSLK